MAGFVIFTVLGFMAQQQGVDIRLVAESGQSYTIISLLLNCIFIIYFLNILSLYRSWSCFHSLPKSHFTNARPNPLGNIVFHDDHPSGVG